MAQVSGLATVERLRDEIQEVRYREATQTFCRLVTEENRPLKFVGGSGIPSGTASKRISYALIARS